MRGQIKSAARAIIEATHAGNKKGIGTTCPLFRGSTVYSHCTSHKLCCNNVLECVHTSNKAGDSNSNPGQEASCISDFSGETVPPFIHHVNWELLEDWLGGGRRQHHHSLLSLADQWSFFHHWGEIGRDA